MTEVVWVCLRGCGEFKITGLTSIETEGTFVGYRYCPVCGKSSLRCGFKEETNER